jgi:hypothetical protein
VWTLVKSQNRKPFRLLLLLFLLSCPQECIVHSKLHNINFQTSNDTPSLVYWNHWKRMFLVEKDSPTPCYHVFFPYITCSNIEINHQRIQTTHLHASRYHHCNVNFVLFHNVTCYINFFPSRIHVNTT